MCFVLELLVFMMSCGFVIYYVMNSKKSFIIGDVFCVVVMIKLIMVLEFERVLFFLFFYDVVVGLLEKGCYVEIFNFMNEDV